MTWESEYWLDEIKTWIAVPVFALALAVVTLARWGELAARRAWRLTGTRKDKGS